MTENFLVPRRNWTVTVLSVVVAVFYVAQGDELRCKRPSPAPDGKPIGEIKESYAVNERVKYKCDYSDNTRIRYCTPGGKWSPMGTVCTDCPDSFTLNKNSGKCYHFPKLKKTFVDAEKYCATEKSVLAIPENEAENAYIASFIRYNIFIGVTDREREGRWKKITGQPVSYTKWHRGEPNNAGRGGEDCVEIGGNGVWNDRHCARDKLYFVCQQPKVKLRHCLDFWDKCEELFDANPTLCTKDVGFAEQNCRFTCGYCLPPDQRAKCGVATPGAEGGDAKILTQGESMEFSCGEGMVALSGDQVRGCTASGHLSGAPLECTKDCPQDWVIRMDNKHCYKLYEVRRNYSAAAADCASMSGTLTTVKDKEEQEFVNSLKGSVDTIWVGLTDSITEGTFRWTDGTRASYTNWAAGEPNDLTSAGEHCVQMLENGKWADKNCVSDISKYMCKVDVEEFGDYNWFWSALRGGVSTLEGIFG
ncbi:mannose-binding protein C [Elysia marginata]|uniref:Mannose-binding protein C n=1 Tax=Elysia marginata TaxID=1093978 RepID=A0AAV4IPD5_9GAST|nr:mannose-binding protein C [Elysia marginata]